MENIPKYMGDKQFLKEFDRMHLKEKFVKITCLDWQENPIEEIQGVVSSGNINVNDSALRRTATLTFLPLDKELTYDLTKTQLALNRKIKIYCGFKNTTGQYPEYDMIWFLQGLFIITSINISQSLSGITCSITAQDKMCLLNGTIGGTIIANTYLDRVVDAVTGEFLYKVTYEQMLKELVNHLGKEDLSRILIDLPEEITAKRRWNGENSLYIYPLGNGEYDVSEGEPKPASEWPEVNSIREVHPQDDFGCTYSPFYWTGEKDLMVSAGSTITSALDTIVKTLGNYEYFYDIYGNFIFQEKKNYTDTVYTSYLRDRGYDEEIDYVKDILQKDIIYDFVGSDIIAAYSNSPNYANIKNDFVVWGTNNSQDKLPIRYRLVIDEKPSLNTHIIGLVPNKDFREDNPIFYGVGVIKAHESGDAAGFLEGQYYYYEGSTKLYQSIGGLQVEVPDGKIVTIEAKNWQTEVYCRGLKSENNGTTDYPDYFLDLKAEWPLVYDLEKNEYKDCYLNKYFFIDMIDSNSDIFKFSIPDVGQRTYIDTTQQDRIHNLFFDDTYNNIMIIPDDEDKEDTIKKAKRDGFDYCVVDPSWICDNSEKVILSGEEEPTQEELNELAIGTHKIEMSYNNISAFDRIRNLLISYTNYNEQITLTTLPIYYLEPNYNIRVDNESVAISGEYSLKSFSIPLDIGGTMQLSASKVVNKI